MEGMPEISMPSDAQLYDRYLAALDGFAIIGICAHILQYQLICYSSIPQDEQGKYLQTEFDLRRELQRLILLYGLPSDAYLQKKMQENPSCPFLRAQIWKALLGVTPTMVDEGRYELIVRRGPSSSDADIRNDTFRTFRGDKSFAQRVSEDQLARLLNAFIMGSELDEEHQESPQQCRVRYVQGMNILCGPFLYVMQECEAYYSFCQLITKHCPQYMAPQLKGVEDGCALVDQCLQILDPELFNHLQMQGVTARIYALPFILSLFACVPPLQELLRLWDALFAIGVHFVVLLAVSYALLLREELLLRKTDLMKILSVRNSRPLRADLLLSLAFRLMHRLPDKVLYNIARHSVRDPHSLESLPYSTKVVEAILARISGTENASYECDVDSDSSSLHTSGSADKAKRNDKCLARPPWK